MPSLLAHREGTTTYSVAAEAVAKARAEQRANNVAESPETAALAVRTELRDRGCCQAGERCFMQGFFGRSNDFMSYDRKKDGASGTRDEALVASRRLDQLSAPEDVVGSVCGCTRNCGRNMPVETIVDTRAQWVAAKNDAEKTKVRRELRAV